MRGIFRCNVVGRNIILHILIFFLFINALWVGADLCLPHTHLLLLSQLLCLFLLINFRITLLQVMRIKFPLSELQFFLLCAEFYFFVGFVWHYIQKFQVLCCVYNVLRDSVSVSAFCRFLFPLWWFCGVYGILCLTLHFLIISVRYFEILVLNHCIITFSEVCKQYFNEVLLTLYHVVSSSSLWQFDW